MRPMMRAILLTHINKIISEKQLKKLPAHGICIGFTLEYLLCSVPFDVIKAKDKWQSEAFKGCLRKHMQIMAPYMQKDPIVRTTSVEESSGEGLR